MKRHTGPIIAAILLLLPVLYVGSYLALVRPPVGIWVGGGGQLAHYIVADYRCCAEQARLFFWPLEQIDRKVRPGAWEPLLINDRPSFHDRRSDPAP